MEYECGCSFGVEDSPWEACCPIHQMPMKVNDVTDDDIHWALTELRRFGHLEEDI